MTDCDTTTAEFDNSKLAEFTAADDDILDAAGIIIFICCKKDMV